MVGATIVSTGERIVNNNLDICFVHGAYNQGPVYESREIITTAMHAGEIATHVRTAGGEDNWLIMPDKSAFPYCVLEWDEGLTVGVSADYDVGNDVRGIPFHKNPGAEIRNVQCADPTVDCQPDHPLHTNSGTAGALKVHTEVALIDPAGSGTGEAFASATVIGDQGATIANRTPMRQMYFLTDPNAIYTTVAYILNT
jgi:hypothetical protein